MGGTLAMEGVKEMKGTSVAYQQKAATAKESYERDHGNDEKATGQGHTVPQTTMTQCWTPRLNSIPGRRQWRGRLF